MAMANNYLDVDYCGEASSSIKLVQEMVSGRRVQLHLRQCQYLSSKMSDTRSFLTGKSNSLVGITSSDDIRRKALRQLHFTVKRAETLVRGCCCEVESSWLESAVTLAQIKEDIVHILLDLRWWSSMVDIAIASVTWVPSGGKIEQELLEVAEKDVRTLLEELKSPDNELEEAFVQDREQLLRRVRDVLSSYFSKPRDLDYLLATHVRTRLENTDLVQSMANVDLNEYKLAHYIGMGSFGAMMDVRWLGRSCALKVLNYKCAKEATSLSAFHHPHIVQFFRYWEAPSSNVSPPVDSHVGSSATVPSDAASTEPEDDLKSHILMERMPTDLANHLKRSSSKHLRGESQRNLSTSKVAPMSQDVAIDAMLQVTKAMSHLNDNNVAHRDLKPSNVLLMPVSEEEFPELAERGYVRVKLGDFGLVNMRAMSSATWALTMKVGTRLYGAPEIFTNESIPEKGRAFPRKADVWSFGIMFSEVLSGQPPFRQYKQYSTAQMQAKIRKGLRPSLPATCPDYLKFIITSCWQLRPQDRPSFTDLWKLLRIAQVRSLGLIQADYDFFTFATRVSTKRLHEDEVFSCVGMRVPFAKPKMPPREPSQTNFNRQQFRAGSSMGRAEDKPLGYLVNLVGAQDEASEKTKLDVIFFEGNVGQREHLSCTDTWVQRGKPGVWWPRDWLSKDFNGDIRVLLLEYSISENGIEGVVEELQKLLVLSDRWNRGHTWDRPIVLVGHSLGCVVIEQLVVALKKRAESFDSLKDDFEAYRARVSKFFLASLSGCFFYAPPYTGLVPIENLLKFVFGGLTYSPTLFNDLCLTSPKLKQLSESFMEARSEGVKLMALTEGFHTRGRTVVPPASMDDFKASGGRVEELNDSNHSDTCKPLDKKHPAYRLLFEFIKEVLKERKGKGVESEYLLELMIRMSTLERFLRPHLGRSPSHMTEPFDHNKHRDNLPQTPFVDLAVDGSAKTPALDRMETGEEEYPKWQPGKSNCLEEYASLSIDDDFLNIELATTLSELLERPNCVLKTLFIEASSRVKVDLEELRKCRLMVIAALSKCVSITSLTTRGSNGEEVHELCKSLSVNKVLENLVISTDGPLADYNALDLSTMLKENHSLKSFTLESGQISPEGFVHLGAMLIKNSSLEELKVDLCMWDKFGLKHLLSPLMANIDGEPHGNIPLKALHILNYNCDGGWEVAQMLRTNKTLSHFSMTNACLSTRDICVIVDSLKINKALQILNLDECKGLDYPSVKVAFMDLLVNYNFTLRTIRMHGRDWDIEAFMKLELELDTLLVAKGRPWSLIGDNAYDLKQALEDFQLEKGEGSVVEMHGSSLKALEEHQEELLVGCSSKRKEMSGLKSKLEMESEQCLQELRPLLEPVMKSTNFLLRRKLNMAQFLQERYSEWNSFAGMYPSQLTNEEKDEFNKGCITAALFPTTFLYHLKVRLLQGPDLRGILHMLKEVAGLVVQRMKSLQDSRSQTFQFIDYVDFGAPLDVQHIYSLRETIAVCQIFSTRTGIGEELQAENSIQYGIMQDHLTGAYYFDSDKSSNLDKPNIDKSTGVIGVKVTSTEIQVEIIWEDGSYYSGALEDFSCDLELDNNKQCAREAFGDLKGAHFLRTHGLKCSPLLVIALAMAIDKRGLALTWGNGKGHIQINSILPTLQPTELEVSECQILYGGHINQLGEAVEWGMNQFNQNHASSSRDNQCQVFFLPNQNLPVSNDTSLDSWSSDESSDISNHTPNIVDLSALATLTNAGAQNKQRMSGGLKILGFGAEVGGEMKYSKGKKIEDQAFDKIQDLHWKEKGGYVIVGNLSDEHRLLEERLFQGSLYAEPLLNYLVVYDHYKESHVSVYWVKEMNDEARLELKWITDIFVKGGLERIKKIFEGLKGETLEVTRTGTGFLENPSQQQSKGLMKWFKNQLSNKDIWKDNALQMVSILEGPPHPIISNDEWQHIVGPQDDICSNKFWWKASYMQAITYSRTIYSSGVLLSTYTIEQYGFKCGRARRKFKRHDSSNYVHLIEDVKSCAKFSKTPQSLSTKWHEMIRWGGLK